MADVQKAVADVQKAVADVQKAAQEAVKTKIDTRERAHAVRWIH